MLEWLTGKKKTSAAIDVTTELTKAGNVIADFGAVVETSGVDLYKDISVLPHPKDKIFDCICLLLRFERDPARVNTIETAVLFLTHFQEGVGKIPVSLALPDTGTSKTEIAALAEKLDNQIQRYTYFEHKADAEYRQLTERLAKIPRPTPKSV